VLNCVLRQHVWSSEAWLSKHGYSLILVRNVVGELQPKKTLAASRGFFVAARLSCCILCCFAPSLIVFRASVSAGFPALKSCLTLFIVSSNKCDLI